MAFRGKALDALTEADVRALVDEQVSEGRTLDFKRHLPGNSRDEKKEFLADVTAFSNADGGHLVCGVDEGSGESEGVAVAVPGVEIESVDGEVLRLTNMIRDGAAPRVPNLRIEAVPVEAGRHVVFVEVPQSFARPHMVTLKGAVPFSLRHSRSSEQMTLDEIRAAFNLSGSMIDRIRQFRRERMDVVINGPHFFPLAFGPPRQVLHVLPLSMMDPSNAVDLTISLERAVTAFPTLGRVPTNARFNFEGPAVVAAPRAYTQVFRQGAVEAVTIEGSQMLQGEPTQINFGQVEGMVIRGLQRYFRSLIAAGARAPFVVGLSLTRVSQCVMFSPRGAYVNPPIDRDNLIVPEVVVNEYPETEDPRDEAAARTRARLVSDAMRPAFDAVWNAGGVQPSPYYGDDGRWIG